jgi:hypothetical protein
MSTANTAKVTDRRRLRFATVDDVVADLDGLVAADKAGTLRRTGNWTPGQVFGHLAAWIDYAYEGYPFEVPWFIRPILRLKKKKYLREGMPAGVRIPKVENGTFGTQTLSTEEGASRLRQALRRLKSGEPAKFDSPAWGRMPPDERIALNLRHAELHLSFLHPQ